MKKKTKLQKRMEDAQKSASPCFCCGTNPVILRPTQRTWRFWCWKCDFMTGLRVDPEFAFKAWEELAHEFYEASNRRIVLFPPKAA